MNKTILYIMLLFFIFPIFLNASPPEWFRNLPNKDYEIIGYGRSRNPEEAKTLAKKEIANSIQTQIISENVFETSEINGTVNEKANMYLEAKTNVVLDDLKILKEERKKREWFVALSYENLPIERKLAKKIAFFQYEPEPQNKYLYNTPLFQSINEVLESTLDIKLKRKNKIWYLIYENIMLPLSPIEFEKLFISTNSDNISLKLSNRSILTEGENFSFSIESNQDGYFSIINVYENGECFVIASNQVLSAENPVKFPDEASESELVAGLFNENQSTYDLYVVLFDTDKINLSRIQTAGEKIVSEERHFKFNEVIEMMNEYEFCTVLIRTRPHKGDSANKRVYNQQEE
jgi:hypothetical protein